MQGFASAPFTLPVPTKGCLRTPKNAPFQRFLEVRRQWLLLITRAQVSTCLSVVIPRVLVRMKTNKMIVARGRSPSLSLSLPTLSSCRDNFKLKLYLLFIGTFFTPTIPIINNLSIATSSGTILLDLNTYGQAPRMWPKPQRVGCVS